MKSSNLSSRISKEIKSKNEEVHNLQQGITKVLLEKYKPKIPYEIYSFNEETLQRRVG